MNPLEAIRGILLAPLQALGSIMQSFPKPPFLPDLPGLSNQTSNYENLEAWEIKRNERGRITGIEIHRDAKFK